MSAYIRAALALAVIRQTRLGLIGFRAPGFYPCVFDELLIRRTFGLGLDHIGLSEVTREMQSGARRAAPVAEFPAIEGGSLPIESVEWIERHYAALSSVLSQSGKRLFAIKDWPEIMGLNDPGGLWPALGWLQEEGYLLAPEGDVNAALSMALLHELTGSIPFFSDISAWDDDSSALAMWHYGGAPCLARDTGEVRYGIEGREVQFTLKPGRATLARVGLHHGQFRILAIGVEVLDRTVNLRRAGGWAKTVNNPARDVIRTMLDDGWEHHLVLVHGDAIPGLQALGRFTNLPVTVL
jgi:L-fucose isomerase-like protein